MNNKANSTKHVEIGLLRKYLYDESAEARGEFMDKISHFKVCEHCCEKFKKSSFSREIIAMLNDGRNN